MKKALLLTWTILLIGIIAYFGYTYFLSDRHLLIDPELVEKQKTNVFDKSRLDEMLSASDYIRLTIGASGCSMCDILLSNRELAGHYMPSYYIDKDHDSKNLLVAQALRTSGFPTSYILNKNYDVVGVAPGMKDLQLRVDSVVTNVSGGERNLPDDETAMIGDSFKAMLTWLDGDLEETYRHTRRSLDHGDGFFNNYMAYLYHNTAGAPDSVAYYKDAALKSAEGADPLIYESLIRELDSESELLQLAESMREPHNHQHDHDHDH